MYKILGSIRTQYWYWFIRDCLIKNELKECTDSKRKERLVRQNKNAALTSIYSSVKMGNELKVLSPYLNLDSEFTNNGNQYRYGTRVVQENTIKLVEQAVPGSQLAHQNGPSGLFTVLEAQSLVSSSNIIAKELLKVLKSKEELLSNDKELARFEEILSSRVRLNIFGGTIKLLNTLEDIIEFLFPLNEWSKFISVVITNKVEVNDIEAENLLNPKYFDLKTIFPIVISFAFIKAKYFDEIHYLSKVCYQERYLTFLNKSFLINEKLWNFEPPKTDEIVKEQSILIEGEASMKHLFHQAYNLANPVFFKDSCF
ncbi:MAG: hypothetical protein ACTJH9_13815 [Pseudoalteromonas sp.]|uniref:hypothetical protein n=1 Tax=Pseudoalteromonas TaxID=53246 RepID=UPI0017881BCF|nr:hypothetical protein [Pseudoalteromonas nigrifaciens]MBE0419055.1 hypothetical protein [Pseudoalteromonas nigrifaciens]